VLIFTKNIIPPAIVLCSLSGFGQLEKPDEKEPLKFSAGIVLGHTWVPTGENSKGERDYVLIPSWGLDLSAEFTEKWGLTLANEIQMQRFLVKTFEGNEIEREYPFTSVIELTYKTRYGLGILLGPGIELEKHRNFFVYRLGFEYAFPINKVWFVKPTIAYEMKELEYSIFNLGIGLGFLR
jgi:hypothetical protein